MACFKVPDIDHGNPVSRCQAGTIWTSGKRGDHPLRFMKVRVSLLTSWDDELGVIVTVGVGSGGEASMGVIVGFGVFVLFSEAGQFLILSCGQGIFPSTRIYTGLFDPVPRCFRGRLELFG